jgi:hypothetical protein
VYGPSAIGRKRPSSLFAAILLKSSRLSTRRLSRAALRRAIFTFSFAVVSRMFGRQSMSGPWISVSGVRNSWLALLKNVVFASSSCASWLKKKEAKEVGVLSI